MDLAVREQINMEEESLCVGPTKTHTTNIIENIIVNIIIPIVVGILMLCLIIPFTLGALYVSIIAIKDIIALF